MGLAVYDEFDEAIVLTTVHRMGQIDDPKTPEDHAYNARAHTFWDIMLRLRDSKITPEDYFWLCRRKTSKLSLSERRFFADAPLLMDFRRSTDDNPEVNCDYHNRQQLRTFANERTISCHHF